MDSRRQVKITSMFSAAPSGIADLEDFGAGSGKSKMTGKIARVTTLSKSKSGGSDGSAVDASSGQIESVVGESSPSTPMRVDGAGPEEEPSPDSVIKMALDENAEKILSKGGEATIY